MEGMKYVLLAIFIRSLYSGMEIISKAVLDEGINAQVFVFYRQAFASVVMLPIAYLCERGRAPAMTFKLFFKIFMHAFIGITITMTLNTIAFDNTTAYTASAANNSMPVCTFIVAIIYGSETVKYRKSSGIAKLLGVALFAIGTATIAFYKGHHINPLNNHHPLGNGTNHSSSAHKNQPALGAFLVIASNTFWAVWMVTLGRLLIEYPSKLLFTALQCLFSAITAFLLAVPFATDFSKWKLGFNLTLISILYCGIIITGVSFYLQSWLIEKKGPVFLALFTPLTLLVTLISSSFLLGEVINIGSVLGGAVMVGGLYSVLWGKSKERNDHSQLPITHVNKLSVNEKESSVVVDQVEDIILKKLEADHIKTHQEING